MATQTLEFAAGTGLTLNCKLFTLGSDTIVASAVAVERTNDLNRYRVSYTDIPAGAYRLNAFIGATGGFANEVYDLTLTTAIFYPRSEQEVSATLPNVIVNVTPGLVFQQDPATKQDLLIYTDEEDNFTVDIFRQDGITPVNLSGMTLQFRVSDLNDTLLYTINSGSITVGGPDNNQITFSKSSLTSNDFEGKWGLRDTANGDKVIAYGRIEILYVP